MSIWAKRYHWQTSHPFENTLLLDAFEAHPEFLTFPAGPGEARVIGAGLLSNPHHIVWTTYQDTELTGVVMLTRIIPRVDALLHFLFIDHNLATKRKLLQNLIGVCFTDFGLNRLSMEVPEGVRLERFCRSVLDFKYEGEVRPRNPELPASLTLNWVAKQGSRRESSFFDGTSWSDVLLLRLLASEWVGTGEREAATCRSEPSQEPPHQSSVG